jgi:hypothetical protein
LRVIAVAGVAEAAAFFLLVLIPLGEHEGDGSQRFVGAEGAAESLQAVEFLEHVGALLHHLQVF